MATIKISHPNFLASAENIVLKTAGVYKNESGVADWTDTTYTYVAEVDANGLTHNVLKAGALINTTDVKGLLYEDVDLTNTTSTNKAAIPVLVQGNYIASKLPVAPSDGAGEQHTGATTPTKATLEAQGLHAQKWMDGAVTRPDDPVV